ncbi:MAG: hypothetical protein AAF211_14565 [Myxococcota bacterium]
MSWGSRALLLALWAGVLGYAALFAPPSRPDQTEWVLRLLTGDWAGEEPWVVVIFNLLGVWPLTMAALLAPSLRRRPVPLWPFVAGSMFLGAFALVPGLALGGESPPMAPWQRALRSPWFRGGLAAVALALLAWAVGAGDPSAYAQAFATDQFVHVMSLDFGLLYVTSVLVARSQGGSWGWSLVPLFGALAVARAD